MSRYSWKGFLRLSLVSVPVQAINAQKSEGGKFRLHQLHEPDHARIRYAKICPVHGEVSSDEIVSGYEVSKDEYVVIEPDELDALRTPAEKAITLNAFIAPEAIDPLYFAGRHYYLLPDGEAGVKPYTVLHRAMSKQGKWAVGQAVMFGHEQLVVVRPNEELLFLEILNYPEELRATDDLEIGQAKVSAAEIHLADTLIKASTSARFNIDDYHDQYTEKMRELIEAKVEGREIVTPPDAEEPVVVNLMDALRRSVAKAGRGSAGKKAAKPPKKVAASHRSQGPRKMRKSS